MFPNRNWREYCETSILKYCVDLPTIDFSGDIDILTRFVESVQNMIQYSLKCAKGHAFESWFQSAEAHDKLAATGMVTCPVCGSGDVEKSIMAPRVRTARSKRQKAEGGALSVTASEASQALQKLKNHIETHSSYVGSNFAAEARAIHLGDLPERSIHGEARADEARKLIEDGIPVAPLPFMPKQKTN